MMIEFRSRSSGDVVGIAFDRIIAYEGLCDEHGNPYTRITVVSNSGAFPIDVADTTNIVKGAIRAARARMDYKGE